MYGRWVKLWRLRHLFDKDQAMQQAVGGEYAAMGKLEHHLLMQYGLSENDYVVDVGCGSGRLAKPLSGYLKGRYLGTDIVPDLIDYAIKVVDRPDWRFELVDQFVIPERDEAADFVCFFSVFTHLLHEQSYVYLKEAKRVLKRGGKIVFSFLEFAIPSHWAVFDSTIRSTNRNHPLNVFVSRDAIDAWSSHLGLQITAIHDGDKPFIRVPYPLTLESGAVIKDLGTLGQSVCVLIKKE
jgi:ubiquinone/menaquinone biosynthesis C-methylase UbiE